MSCLHTSACYNVNVNEFYHTYILEKYSTPLYALMFYIYVFNGLCFKNWK